MNLESKVNLCLIIMVIIVIYLFMNKSHIEGFSETIDSTALQNIASIYNNKKLIVDELEVRGNATITGKTTIANDLVFKSPDRPSRLIRNNPITSAHNGLVSFPSKGNGDEIWAWEFPFVIRNDNANVHIGGNLTLGEWNGGQNRIDGGSIIAKGGDVQIGDTIRLTSDANNSYLQTKKDNGFIIAKWATSTPVPVSSQSITTGDLYVNNIGKAGNNNDYIRINNIGKSGRVAIFGGTYIYENKDGYGGLNLKNWTENAGQSKILVDNIGLTGKGWVTQRGAMDNHWAWAR